MFKKKTNPADFLKQIFEALDTNNKQELDRVIQSVKTTLANANVEVDLSEFIEMFYKQDIMIIFLNLLPSVELEIRKDICVILSFFVHRGLFGQMLTEGESEPYAEYILKHPEIMDKLLNGLQNEMALTNGQILLEFAKMPETTRYLLEKLYRERFQRLFGAMDSAQFEVSSSACLLFKELLTHHAEVTTTFLSTHPEFFSMVFTLAESQNFATRRFALQQLGDILLNKLNYEPMLAFSQREEYLKSVMEQIKAQSPAIRLEAFHLFKIFVACPTKSEGVKKILMRNKDKLVLFLEGFKLDAGEVVEEEKQFVIQTLKELQ